MLVRDADEGSLAARRGRVIDAGGPLPTDAIASPAALGVAEQASLLDLVYDAVFVWSLSDHRITFWNQGATDLYGFSRAEALGADAGSLLTTTYPAPLEEIERKVVERGRWEGELRQVRRDGTTVVVDSRWALSTDAVGAPSAVLEVNRDITGRRAAERVLGESEERFKLLVEGVRDYAIFMLDPNGLITSWNSGAERIKQYSADEVIGRHFSIFYTPDDRSELRAEQELRTAAETGVFQEEGWRVRKDGQRFWASVVLTALRGEDGTLRGFAKVTRDMTDQRRARQRLESVRRREMAKLREHAKRMAELENIKTQFLHLASHELRGPMTVLRGYLSMLHDGALGPLSEEADRVVGILGAKAQEMSTMIDQLLEVARLEDGRLDLRVAPVDLRGVAEDSVARLRPGVSRRHRLQLDLPKRPVVVDGDADRLATVLVNLLDNAVKYSPAGGRIRCTVGVDGAEAVIGVADQGIGIAAADIPRLFTRFGRLVTKANSHIAGTGLGLYLCRALVERHGGGISVTSAEGKGSTFTVRLPLSSAGAGATATPSEGG